MVISLFRDPNGMTMMRQQIERQHVCFLELEERRDLQPARFRGVPWLDESARARRPADGARRGIALDSPVGGDACTPDRPLAGQSGNQSPLVRLRG